MVGDVVFPGSRTSFRPASFLPPSLLPLFPFHTADVECNTWMQIITGAGGFLLAN